MFVRQCVQSVFVSRVAVSDSGLWLNLRVELHLLEKKDSDLLWGQYVEIRLLGHFPYSVLYLLHFCRQRRGISAQLCQIDLHSFHFHLGQDRQQRLFHSVIQHFQLQFFKFFPYFLSKHQRGNRFWEACGFCLLCFCHVIKKRQTSLFFLFGKTFLQVYSEIGSCQQFQLMALFRIDKIVHQLYVHQPAFKLEAVVRQYVALKLQVVSVFDDIRVGQNLLEVGSGAAGSDEILASMRCNCNFLYLRKDSRLIAFNDDGASSCL